MASRWGLTPRQSLAAECERRGQSAVAADCVAILRGEGFDDAFLTVLAGPASAAVLQGYEGGPEGHWPRVWAARGLLYAWDESASSAIAEATTDEAWRVREMAGKVIARHRVGAALDAVVALSDDPVPRVRAAAERAVRTLTVERA